MQDSRDSQMDDLEAEIIANRQEFLKRVLESIAHATPEPKQSTNPSEQAAPKPETDPERG